jgi:hypothetical protein
MSRYNNKTCKEDIDMSAISTATRLVCKKVSEELDIKLEFNNFDTTEDLIYALKDKFESVVRLGHARGLFKLADRLNIQLNFNRDASEYDIYDIEKIESMVADSLLNRVNNILNNVVRNVDSHRVQALYEVIEALGINPTTIDLNPEAIAQAVKSRYRGPIA